MSLFTYVTVKILHVTSLSAVLITVVLCELQSFLRAVVTITTCRSWRMWHRSSWRRRKRVSLSTQCGRRPSTLLTYSAAAASYFLSSGQLYWPYRSWATNSNLLRLHTMLFLLYIQLI